MREKELADYLRQNKGYQRILETIIERYRRLGKLGGTIVLGQLTEEEVEILSPYDYHVSETKTCKITVKKFIEGLCRGKFEGVDFEEALRLYSGEALMSNKEVKEKKQETTEQFYKKLIEGLNCREVKNWFVEALDNKAYGYYTFHKLYPKAQEQLKEMIVAIDDLVSYRKINQDWILLPVLASLITRDTHYFDLNKIEGKLLLYYFSYKQGVSYPGDIQTINEVLTEERIIRDQISNSTSCYGLYGKTENQAKPWEVFWEMGEPLQLSLYNLKDVCEMTAKRQRVYIVENPAVFSGLLETAIQKEVGLICTSGQLNTSSYMILDLLDSNHIMMYYNGDFDPEGIQIADKLKQRYPKLHLWCYDVADYLKIKGQVQIEERINKLDRIQSEGLKALAMQMKKEKTAGYQELLLERLIQSIE